MRKRENKKNMKKKNVIHYKNMSRNSAHKKNQIHKNGAHKKNQIHTKIYDKIGEEKWCTSKHIQTKTKK